VHRGVLLGGPGSDYNTHGHYINMMGPYATLGCGIYTSGTTVTVVQDYGIEAD